MFNKAAFLILLFLLSGCGQVFTKPLPTPPPTLAPTSSSPENVQITPTIPTPTFPPSPRPATPEPTASPTPEPTPIVHIIQQGDTLIGLARRYGVTVQSIQEANGVTDPRSLLVGQEIIIPTDPGARLASGTPTPRPTPPPIQIGPILFHRGADGLWAFGQITLLGESPLEGINVGIDLLDEHGERIASAQASLLQELLTPQENAGFVLRFYPPPPNFDRYQLSIRSALPAHVEFFHRDLSIENVLVQQRGASVTSISGEVKNIGTIPAMQVAVIVTLLDASNQVVGLRRVRVAPPDLLPGDTAYFTAELIPVRTPIADYRLLAEGHRDLNPNDESDR